MEEKYFDVGAPVIVTSDNLPDGMWVVSGEKGLIPANPKALEVLMANTPWKRFKLRIKRMYQKMRKK